MKSRGRAPAGGSLKNFNVNVNRTGLQGLVSGPYRKEISGLVEELNFLIWLSNFFDSVIKFNV